MKLDGLQALERLREGNRRFAEGLLSLESLLTHARRKEQALTQEPFAIVLGCSDSRAPAEIVFDQGLGDLFVIRVAGNIAAPSQIGSIEFAAERFGVRLVVVLGHSRCGAVQATIDCLNRPGRCSPALHAIVDRIRPAVQPLCRTGSRRRPRAADGRRRARQRARHGQHAAPWLAGARGAGAQAGAADRRRRVFTRYRRGRFLRGSTGLRERRPSGVRHHAADVPGTGGCHGDGYGGPA